MGAETTSSENPHPRAVQPERGPRAVRILAFAAVGAGLSALCAATFVLSYGGIHALALHAGIAPRLARGYPLLMDAMLVIVLAAVLALRGAGLPSRLLAWATLLAVLAASAGADALHAASRQLPGQVGAVTAAVLPWVLVLLAFVLLLAMLRQARLRRLAATRSSAAAHGQALAWSHHSGQPGRAQPGRAQPGRAQPGRAQPGTAGTVPGPGLSVLRPAPAPSAATRPDAGLSGSGPAEPELAVDAEPAQDNPSSDEASPRQADGSENTMHAGQTDQTGPDQTGPDQTGPDQTGPDQAEGARDLGTQAGQDHEAGAGDEPAEAGSELAEPAEARHEPAEAGSELAEPAEARDEPAGQPEAASELAEPAELDGQAGGQAGQAAEQGERDDPDMPVFHRMWSSPTPPEPLA